MLKRLSDAGVYGKEPQGYYYCTCCDSENIVIPDILVKKSTKCCPTCQEAINKLKEQKKQEQAKTKEKPKDKPKPKTKKAAKSSKTSSK